MPQVTVPQHPCWSVHSSQSIQVVPCPNYRFALRSIIETLKAAASTYDSALQHGQIVSASDYQDGRGYLFAADAELSRIEKDLALINADALREIKATLTDLKRAWPSLAAPAAVTMSADGPAALVARIDELAEPFWGAK